MPKYRDYNFDELCKFTERQQDAVNAIEVVGKKYLLYGGALGGGKSYWLRWYAFKHLLVMYARYGIKGLVVMLACEDYPALKDRQLSKIGYEFPEWAGKMYLDHSEYGRSWVLDKDFGGGVICFRNLDDPSKYASAEFCGIFVDELTKNAHEVFTFLRTRLRWPGVKDEHCIFAAGSNPGGVGHGWVKAYWMDKIFPEEFIHPIDYRPQFAYIPSLAKDNPNLPESYWQTLNTLPEALRKAFRDGDWNTFVGQVFQEWNRNIHVVPMNTPIPEGSPIYMTFDWGFGAPFSVGWWWVDADNRKYRFKEWYGWTGTPNTGKRLSDSGIAMGILSREKDWGLTGKVKKRIAGPDCFQKRPNYMGGGQLPPTAKVFRDYGIIIYPGDPNRDLKIRQFHGHLAIRDGQVPMLQVYENCDQFIRTIPNLTTDKNNPEEIDDKGEDHVFDESCHIFMARPINEFYGTSSIMPVERKVMDIHDVAMLERDQIMKDLNKEADYGY